MTVHYKIENHIAELTLDRQEVRNAMDLETFEELNKCFIDIRDNPEVWAAIITGAGDKAFSSGADVAKLLTQLAEAGKSLPEAGVNNIMYGFEIWKPIIAAVNGLALGGGLELAMACDIRIASENASFGLTEPRIGLMPLGGGTQRLPRLVPLPIAMELLFTARRIDAQEAYRIGLVNKVVSLPELMPTAHQMAEEVCSNAPLSVRAVKEAALRGLGLSLRDGIALEAFLGQHVTNSEDSKEGVAAFLEKRKPQWKAR